MAKSSKLREYKVGIMKSNKIQEKIQKIGIHQEINTQNKFEAFKFEALISNKAVVSVIIASLLWLLYSVVKKKRLKRKDKESLVIKAISLTEILEELGGNKEFLKEIREDLEKTLKKIKEDKKRIKKDKIEKQFYSIIEKIKKYLEYYLAGEAARVIIETVEKVIE